MDYVETRRKAEYLTLEVARNAAVKKLSMAIIPSMKAKKI